MTMNKSYLSPDIITVSFEDYAGILCISAGADRTIEQMEWED